MRKPKNIKSLQERSRRLRTAVIAPPHNMAHFTVIVSSSSSPARNHFVTVAFGDDDDIRAHCTCPYGQHDGLGCAHIFAALEALAHRKGRTISFWPDEPTARRQKRRVFRLHGARPSPEAIFITSRPDTTAA